MNILTHSLRFTLFALTYLVSFSLSAMCEFAPWSEYQDTPLYIHNSEAAYLFISNHKAIDADGAPNAYHPANKGLDYLANAGYPKSDWWPDVLVQNPQDPSRAYVQKEGPYRGFFVSKTSLQDTSKTVTDTSRYVDASNIPYLVFPGSFYRKKGTGRLGDLGYAINLISGESSPFVVADVGPTKAKLGEMSIALAENLGGKQINPRNGGVLPTGDIAYVIFTYSSRQYPWPLTVQEMRDHTITLFEQIDGELGIRHCVQKFNG